MLLAEELVKSIELALPELLLQSTKIRASPGEVKSHRVGSSRRSQDHRTGLCPKLLSDHTKYGALPDTIIYAGITDTQVLHMDA